MTKFEFRPLVAAIVIACALSGCGERSADESLAAAKAHLDKRDGAAAIIELKNTLQSKPDDAEARFLLGKALLDRGESVEAAVELSKAQALKYPDEQVIPLLGKAFLEAGEVRKVVELDKVAALERPSSVANLKTSIALAYAAQGNPQKADSAIAEALKAEPEYGPALLYRARTLAGDRDYDGALKLVDGVLARTPADPDALNLRGDLLQFGKQDVAAAMELYRKALTVKPDSVEAHSALITRMLAQNDVDAARIQLEALEKHRRRHPRTLYFKARVASLQGDVKLANELTQDLLKAMPDNIPVLQLAGIVALQTGELVQAEQRFSKIVHLAPDSIGGRQMLAQVYLRVGNYQKVLETLKPILDSGSPDFETLSMAGTAHLSAGDVSNAEALLSRAVKLKPGDAANRTVLARARLARGDTSGFGELEEIAIGDSGTTADIALISANIGRRNFDAALKAVDRLETKQPDKPLAAHLRAQILARRGDLSEARASYDKALSIDNKFFPAIDGLAALDLRENKPEQARARFEALLKAEPSNTQAMLALAKLDDRAGKPSADVAAMIAKAIAANPADPVLRQRLVQHFLGKGDVKSALGAAQAAASALPDNPVVLGSLARAQLAAGETAQAARTYGKLVSMRPNSPDPYLGLASTYVATKDYAAALESVKKALVIAPEHSAANEQAVALYVRIGQHDEAVALARSLQKRLPGSVLGYGLLGDVEMSRRNWSAAAAAYESALKLKSDSLLAQRLHGALLAGAKQPQANALAKSWIQKRPNDAAFLLYLGGVASDAKDYETAEARFARVLELQPDNALALNNLAWAMHELKKPGALAHAERANQLRPNTPALMDTWAILLAESDQVARALDLQKRAVALAPDAPALRLTLARVYLKAGEKSAARTELERLQNLGDTFPDQKLVQELLAKV